MLILVVFIISCSTDVEIDSVPIFSQIQELPEILAENSGMIEYESLIWFINDSGNDSALYGYDKDNNEIVRTVNVSGADNTDWEDITQNSSQIFIGDFGNNGGNRTDLRIYIINKTDLTDRVTTVVPVGIIYFEYENQTDFTYSGENTPFDCEAFIATDDSIFLFTKDWVSYQTGIYSIPVESGTYSAQFRMQIYTNGLITSAAWSADGDHKLVLLGYTPAIPFIWIFEDFNPDNLSYSSRKQIQFFEYYATQTEGVFISDDGSVYMSSEAISNLTINKPAQLFKTSLDLFNR